MRIGVLALQGDFLEHRTALRRLGLDTREIRLPVDLPGCGGLIIPGGESTTLSLLLDRFGLREAIKDFNGPVWGTCAGAILMAKSVSAARSEGKVEPLGFMDIVIERNAYGRQTESFEADVDVGEIGKIRGVFIRAPKIAGAGPLVSVLGTLGGSPVLVRQGRFLAGTFHPELTMNLNLHHYFVNMILTRSDLCLPKRP